MKFLILFVTLISISAFSNLDFVDLASLENTQQNPNCRKTKYGGIGATCENNSTLLCKNFLTCQSGNCKPGWIGAACLRHDDCYLGLEESVRCIASKCTKKRYNGYGCSIGDECYSKTCTNGICSGYGLGENCSPITNVQCSKDLFCAYAGGVCAKQKKVGDDCSDFDQRVDRSELPEGSNYFVICPGGSMCISGANGNNTCSNVYYKKEGDSCSDQRECQFPLRCGSGVCSTRTFGDVPCGAVNCTTALNQRCVCLDNDAATCKATANSGCSFQNALNSWYACNKQFNCQYEKNVFTAFQTEMFQKETCMGQNCGHIPKASLCCRNAGFENSAWSTANNGPIDCSSSSGVVAVVIIIILVLVSAVAVSGSLLAIYLYQRRKSESFERLPD